MSPKRIMPLSFSPRDSQESADMLRVCTRLKGEGRSIKAGIVESPFRPAAGIAISEITSTIKDVESLNASDEALVLLDHGGMDQIREISPPDYLAVVDGGVKLGAFVDEVKRAGLFFPHEPECFLRGATVAEIIMDGTLFGTDGRFGALREYVLSLELAIPKGEIIRTGSRSVKDVAGYNVAGFLMGLGGLCGLISKATFRLLPAPPSRVRFASSGAPEKIEVFAQVVRRAMDPFSLEMFEGAAARLFGGRLGEGRGAGALLLGEVSWVEPGAEEKVLEKLSSLAPANVSINSLDESGGLMRIAFDALERGHGVYRYLIDADARGPGMEEAFSWRSLRPRRLHVIAARNADGESFLATGCGAPDRKTDSPLESLLIEAYSAGRRMRIELIERAGDGFSRRRIHDHEIRKALADAGAGRLDSLRKRLEQEELLDRLAERVLESFDPRGIMVP